MSNYPPPPPPPPGQPSDPSAVPPGMYRASDGNVYPQQGPQMTQPPPPKKKGKGGKVLLIVAGAIVALCALGGVLAAISGNSGEDVQTGSSATTVAGAPAKADEASLYPNRPDKKKGDKERAAGQSADLSGYTVTMVSGTYKKEINQFEKDGYVVADVSISNRDKDAQSYNTFEWKLLTPAGTIIDPCICGGKQLGSGDLVTGGKIDGQLTFEVGNVKGAYYLIYDPSDLGSERAIWQITV